MGLVLREMTRDAWLLCGRLTEPFPVGEGPALEVSASSDLGQLGPKGESTVTTPGKWWDGIRQLPNVPELRAGGIGDWLGRAWGCHLGMPDVRVAAEGGNVCLYLHYTPTDGRSSKNTQAS